MKLKTLKKLLNELPAEFDNKEVIMSSDPEGNGYHGLGNVDTTCAKKEGYYYELVWNEDGETQPPDNTVILWPS